MEDDPRQLFEYDAHLVPVPRTSRCTSRTRRFPGYTSRGRYVAEWLEANAGFRAYVLDELDRRGPLRSADLEDRAVVPYATGGWDDGKNLGRMLELLQWGGVLVSLGATAPSAGGTASSASSPWRRRAGPRPARRGACNCSIYVVLRANGVALRGRPGPLDDRHPQRSAGEAALIADGVAAPVKIDSVKFDWLAHA